MINFDWKKFGWGVIIFDLLVVNGAVGYAAYNKIQGSMLKVQDSKAEIQGDTVHKTVYQDLCGEECQRYIDQKIAAIATPAQPAGPSATPVTPKAAAAQPIKKKVRSVTYVTIPGSGKAMTNIWTDLTGTEFYFDPADYPGLVEVYFEASMRLFNGNGIAYVRLYDTAHGIGVQGSDVQSTSQTSAVVVSGKVSFWAGKNLIRVQAKSLTADTAMYDSGRLRIVTEN